MFKKLLLFICISCLFSEAFAAVFLVEPVDKRLENSEAVVLGNIAKGETLRIVARKKSEQSAEWNTIIVDLETLPQGWKFSARETDKTIIAELSLPANAQVSTQRLEFTVSNKSQPSFAETFYANISVRDKLMTATIENLSQRVVVGETANMKLIVSNDSVAEHRLAISSNLPTYWFEPLEVIVTPNGTTETDLNINAVAYGERNFKLEVSSLQNDTVFCFPASLGIAPTLQGKYVSALFGFPFFAPSLLPYYVVNGFLSLLS